MVAGWGAAGEQRPVPGRGGSGPPSPSPQLCPQWPWSPVGAAGMGSAVCSATQEPVGQTLPGAVWCCGLGGREGCWAERGPRATPRGGRGWLMSAPSSVKWQGRSSGGCKGPAPMAHLPRHTRSTGSCLAGRCQSVPGGCQECAVPSFLC